MQPNPTAVGKIQFRIRGMDCAEEVAILNCEVGPLGAGEDKLDFDLLNGKMIVSPEAITLLTLLVLPAMYLLFGKGPEPGWTEDELAVDN